LNEIKNFTTSYIKTILTYKRPRFILQILYSNTETMIYFLKQIEKQINSINKQMKYGLDNSNIAALTNIKNNLATYNSSLKANELVYEKLQRYDFIRAYPEDSKLLSAVLIENKQAIEMAKVYNEWVKNMLDASVALSANNLNFSVKSLRKFIIAISILIIILLVLSQVLNFFF